MEMHKLRKGGASYTWYDMAKTIFQISMMESRVCVIQKCIFMVKYSNLKVFMVVKR